MGKNRRWRRFDRGIDSILHAADGNVDGKSEIRARALFIRDRSVMEGCRWIKSRAIKELVSRVARRYGELFDDSSTGLFSETSDKNFNKNIALDWKREINSKRYISDWKENSYGFSYFEMLHFRLFSKLNCPHLFFDKILFRLRYLDLIIENRNNFLSNLIHTLSLTEIRNFDDGTNVDNAKRRKNGLISVDIAEG